MQYVLQEWLNISYLLATNIDKPKGNSKIEFPALEGLNIAFLYKEFPKPQLTLSYPGCCAMERSNARRPARAGGKYLHKQRGAFPEPEHCILSLCQ